jgi:hypothetical protein
VAASGPRKQEPGPGIDKHLITDTAGLIHSHAPYPSDDDLLIRIDRANGPELIPNPPPPMPFA